ncbi:phosphotriesterase [Lysinibacillus yapensis]|uniref:Phosphotriesterase n=1 Tax=Ureibacillus yapensis TaxID=2304605 RepID=A0A396S6R1_9BACL|nr:phosphotriesterase [Lysinibacillus yapensis]RHW32366.1 phosphotriesterase [Lysinibacillus yapensis]
MQGYLEQNDSEVVLTVLGPISAQELGVVLIHESLLSVLPGAELAPEVDMDTSEIFAALKSQLLAFRRLGGKTIVDSGGMFHGRNVKLYETLSKATGINIVASTGLGPEPLLSGYFLTPQKNPPIPWQAEQFADLFAKEVTEGIVVPRVERSGPAGMATSIASRNGLTEIEKNLFRGCAQTALATGVPVSVQYGANAMDDLNILLNEGLAPNRIIIGGLDRIEAVKAKEAIAIARQGAMVALDHIGWTKDEGYVNDGERIRLILELFEEGLGDQVLLSTNAVGVAKGYKANGVGFDYLLSTFVPLLRAAGLNEEQVHSLLAKNPLRVLTVDKVAVAIKETIASKN